MQRQALHVPHPLDDRDVRQRAPGLVEEDVADHLRTRDEEERAPDGGDRDGAADDGREHWSDGRLERSPMDRDEPAEDDREWDDAPHLEPDVEPEQDAGHGAPPGARGQRLRAFPRSGEDEQREQQQRALRGDEPRRPLDVRRHLPHDVDGARGERRASPGAARDQRHEHDVHGAEHHEREPRGGEPGGVADQVPERGERREHDQDPGWVQQQEVAIRDAPVEQRDRRPEVDAVVVGHRAEQAAAPEHGDQADGQGDGDHAGEEREVSPRTRRGKAAIGSGGRSVASGGLGQRDGRLRWLVSVLWDRGADDNYDRRRHIATATRDFASAADAFDLRCGAAVRFAPMASHVPGVRLAELVASLSLATDLGLGQPQEHILRQTVIATRLARFAGLSDQDVAATYYVSLLAWVGCVADSHEMAHWFDDDTEIRAASYQVNRAGMPMLRFLVGHIAPGESPLRRGAMVGRLMTGGLQEMVDGFAAHCQTTSEIAARLGFGDEVRAALPQALERWDGKGHPAGLAGEQIQRVMRVGHIANETEVFWRLGGIPSVWRCSPNDAAGNTTRRSWTSASPMRRRSSATWTRSTPGAS